MTYFRAFWDNDTVNVTGCTDGEASSESEFIQKLWKRFSEEFDEQDRINVYSVEERFPKFCPKCGQEMINLGLIYDECGNEACDLYLKDPRPFMGGNASADK